MLTDIEEIEHTVQADWGFLPGKLNEQVDLLSRNPPDRDAVRDLVYGPGGKPKTLADIMAVVSGQRGVPEATAAALLDVARSGCVTRDGPAEGPDAESVAQVRQDRFVYTKPAAMQAVILRAGTVMENMSAVFLPAFE